MRLLIAGASGSVGRECLRLAALKGYTIRALARQPGSGATLAGFTSDVRLADATDAGAIEGICEGVTAVISLVGASLSMKSPERRGFEEVDVVANRNLIAEASRAGVHRFLYLSAHSEPGYASTAYARAHTAVEESLEGTAFDWTVFRPTGLFPAFGEMFAYARLGALPLVGSGEPRTNPVSHLDVAEAMVEAVGGGVPRFVDFGGPEVFTRRQISELMLTVAGKPPRLVPLGETAFRAMGAMQSMGSRRKKEVIDFVWKVFQCDCLAPARGKRRLEDYLRELMKA
jgi:uncharacterized protein YbjT (DUF2867 family)